MVDWIRKELGATTLRYQKIEDMVEAIGLPKEKLCLYCWTGDYRNLLDFGFWNSDFGLFIPQSTFRIPQ